MYFSTLNLNMLLELLYHPQFLCDRIFFKCNFSEFSIFVTISACFKYGWSTLTLILLTWRIWWVSNNASKWQMGFDSAFKGLKFFGVKVVRLYSKRALALLLDTRDMDTNYQGFPHWFNSCARTKRDWQFS